MAQILNVDVHASRRGNINQLSYVLPILKALRGYPFPAIDVAIDEMGERLRGAMVFVFNLPHLSLKKGDRMVLTIAEFNLPYKDIFTLNLPFAPPPEVRGNFNNEQQREMAAIAGKLQEHARLRVIDHEQFAQSRKMPQLDRPKLADRGESAAIGRERHISCFLEMTRQAGDRTSSARLPQPDCPIHAAGCQRGAIRRESQPTDEIVMTD